MMNSLRIRLDHESEIGAQHDPMSFDVIGKDDDRNIILVCIIEQKVIHCRSDWTREIDMITVKKNELRRLFLLSKEGEEGSIEFGDPGKDVGLGDARAGRIAAVGGAVEGKDVA